MKPQRSAKTVAKKRKAKKAATRRPASRKRRPSTAAPLPFRRDAEPGSRTGSYHDDMLQMLRARPTSDLLYFLEMIVGILKNDKCWIELPRLADLGKEREGA